MAKAIDKRWGPHHKLDEFAALSATVESAEYLPPRSLAQQDFPAPDVAWGGVYQIHAARQAERFIVCVWRVGVPFESR